MVTGMALQVGFFHMGEMTPKNEGRHGGEAHGNFHQHPRTMGVFWGLIHRGRFNQSKNEVIWGFKDRYYTCIILFFIQLCKDESTKSLEKGLNAGWGERDFVVVFCFENGCITESSFGAPFCWGISEGAIRSSHFSVSNICCDQPNRRVGSHSQKVMFIVSGNADPQNGRNIKLI